MKRRDFVQYAGMGAGAMMMPSLLLGNDIPAEALLEPGMDTVLKKKMADVALNTAKSMGATYADARTPNHLVLESVLSPMVHGVFHPPMM